MEIKLQQTSEPDYWLVTVTDGKRYINFKHDMADQDMPYLQRRIIDCMGRVRRGEAMLCS